MKIDLRNPRIKPVEAEIILEYPDINKEILNDAIKRLENVISSIKESNPNRYPIKFICKQKWEDEIRFIKGSLEKMI